MDGREHYDAVFASDVHLSSAHPSTTEAFLRFVDDVVAGRTEHFFILGDLFEYWVGDDDFDDALAQVVAAHLRRIADQGVAISFMAGNRDFLIGDAFAAAAGLTRLPDPYRTRLGGVELLLSHGDALCIDDVDYQRFRTMVRDPRWQDDFLAKPLTDRRVLIAGARQQSEAAKREKTAAIMDANDQAVCALLAGHPTTVLIHGHTHRPAHHLHVVEDAPRERWVLTDWDGEANPPRGGGLALWQGRLVALPVPVG